MISDKLAPTDLKSIWKHRSKTNNFLAKDNIFTLLIGMEKTAYCKEIHAAEPFYSFRWSKWGYEKGTFLKVSRPSLKSVVKIPFTSKNQKIYQSSVDLKVPFSLCCCHYECFSHQEEIHCGNLQRQAIICSLLPVPRMPLYWEECFTFPLHIISCKRNRPSFHQNIHPCFLDEHKAKHQQSPA